MRGVGTSAISVPSACRMRSWLNGTPRSRTCAEHAHLVERGEQVALHGDAVADAVPPRADFGQVDADTALREREREHAAGYPAADDKHR